MRFESQCLAFLQEHEQHDIQYDASGRGPTPASWRPGLASCTLHVHAMQLTSGRLAVAGTFVS